MNVSFFDTQYKGGQMCRKIKLQRGIVNVSVFRQFVERRLTCEKKHRTQTDLRSSAGSLLGLLAVKTMLGLRRPPDSAALRLLCRTSVRSQPPRSSVRERGPCNRELCGSLLARTSSNNTEAIMRRKAITWAAIMVSWDKRGAMTTRQCSSTVRARTVRKFTKRLLLGAKSKLAPRCKEQVRD
jgi:hypothetical protein